MLAPSIENEKRHASALVQRTKMVQERTEVRLRRLIGDSQCSSGRVRDLVEYAVIPYASNQRGVDVLRIDRRFRTHSPGELVEKYHKRPMTELASAS